MKRNILTIFCLGAILIAPSCAKETLETGKSNDAVKTVPMTLSVCDENSDPDGKTVLDGIQEGKTAVVKFTSADKLFVLGEKDGDIKGTQFNPVGQGRRSSYDFTTENWPEGYSPIYAISSTSKDTRQTCTADGKVTMLVNNATQNFTWSNSYAVNTAAHIGVVEKGTPVRLKNICGLIQFSVTNAEIVKIVVTANGGEPLGGWITVDYSQLESEDPAGFYTLGADVYKILTLTVADKMDNGTKTTGGKFPTDNKYFIPLLPGVYSRGITITMFNRENNKVMTREINSSLTIKRGEIRKFTNPIDDGKAFVDPEMPKTVTFTIEGKWPFEEEPKDDDKQAEDGDEYTYKYEAYNGYTQDFKFLLGGVGGGKYSSSGADVFCVGGDTEKTNVAYIKLPAIDGRVLKSVTLRHRNSGSRTFYVSANENGSDLVTAAGVQNVDEVVELYASGDVKTKPNTSYYLRVPKHGTKCTKIEAEYVEPFPKSETIVLDCTDAANFRYLKDGVSTQLPDDGHSKVLTECDFWLDGKEEYIFHGTVQRWGSENLNADKNSPVKLPTIEGYKLSNVNIASYSQSARTIKLTDGTKDLASITLLRADGYNDMVIDDTQAEGNDRYIVSASELGVKFTLTYKLIK